MTQTDRLLIALTRPFPRTVDALHAETRIPKPSIRRILSTLDVQDYESGFVFGKDSASRRLVMR